MPHTRALDLGRASHDDALARQRRCVERTRADGLTRVVVVEHDPPVITLGRRGGGEDVLAPPERLAVEGVELRRTRRGGQVTWHGPGQLVAYVVRRLGRRGRTVRGHVRLLERAVIETLRRFGIDAGGRDGDAGVWVAGRKIAAVGVAVERWTAYHGLALNVDCDLAAFEMIVPCGDAASHPTSMTEALARPVSVGEVKPVLLECLGELLAGDVRPRGRLPAWLRKRVPAGGRRVHNLLSELDLATVCAGARCPNRAECFARGTATFMVLGTRCTRDCCFCAIESGPPAPPRADEPEAVAEAADRLGLKHVVVTSVTRDDLPDGGAGHFARVIRAVRDRRPGAAVEVLVPDFQGDADAVDTVLDARPDVFNHNVETVARLYPAARPRADYRRSLDVLARAAARGGVAVKSGLMAGLGETPAEVLGVMRDLRAAGCELVTIGQYLAPTGAHLPVARFVPPPEFDRWRRAALGMGFTAVAAGPFVRSSYRAEELFGRQ